MNTLPKDVKAKILFENTESEIERVEISLVDNDFAKIYKKDKERKTYWVEAIEDDCKVKIQEIDDFTSRDYERFYYLLSSKDRVNNTRFLSESITLISLIDSDNPKFMSLLSDILWVIVDNCRFNLLECLTEKIPQHQKIVRDQTFESLKYKLTRLISSDEFNTLTTYIIKTFPGELAHWISNISLSNPNVSNLARYLVYNNPNLVSQKLLGEIYTDNLNENGIVDRKLYLTVIALIDEATFPVNRTTHQTGSRSKRNLLKDSKNIQTSLELIIALKSDIHLKFNEVDIPKIVNESLDKYGNSSFFVRHFEDIPYDRQNLLRKRVPKLSSYL